MKSGIVFKKPISLWNKPLKTNFRDFFKSLSKLVVHGASGNLADAAIDVTETLTQLGVSTEAGEKAWLLLRGSLERAMLELVTESRHRFDLKDTEKNQLMSDLDFTFEDAEFTINQEFIDRPAESPILDIVLPVFNKWLIGSGLTESQAGSIINRFPSYFVNALNEEWRKNKKHYDSILKELDTPFAKSEARSIAWNHYAAKLNKVVDEPLFDEPFSLRQVYIPLRAYREKRLKKQERKVLKDKYQNQNSFFEDDRFIRDVVDLRTVLFDWIQNADPKDAIRIISGGPGSGKSSFLRMFSVDFIKNHGINVVYVPLHLFELLDDLISSLNTYAKEDTVLPENPIDPKNTRERIVIFFDGLDELAMQGKVSTQLAQRFLREVDRSVVRLNQHNLKIQTIISSRELVIQEHKDEFRKDGQVLYVLPYVKTSSLPYLRDRDSLMSKDQRDQWWKIYGKCRGKAYTGIPDDLKSQNFVEITAQPLLNYLLALSYERGKLDFSEEPNLNFVYEDLLAAVYERGWERQQYITIRGMSEDDFVRILEEIALATWHGDGRSASVERIQKYCEITGLSKVLDKFEEGAKSGVTRLLTAFYFRESGLNKEDEKTFEFTHKSFSEYLVARRLIRLLRTIALQIKRRRNRPDDGWSEREALKAWTIVCGPAQMDHYLFDFVCSEIQQKELIEVTEWQNILIELFELELRQGLPMELIEARLSFQEQQRQARNAKEAILACLNACARYTKQISSINWPTEVAFGSYLGSICGQSKPAEKLLAKSCLSYLDISGQVLIHADLSGANFENSNLEGASMFGACLNGANLSAANLVGATMRQANLSQANLNEAKIKDASFLSARIEGIKTKGASGKPRKGPDIRNMNEALSRRRYNIALHRKEKASRLSFRLD